MVLMQTFDELLAQAEVAHGHLCAGQILGVRMATLGCQRLGIDDPRGADRKRLVTFVEIDRCATDAIAVVTGCRLGKRALKFRDWGKMAATFVDLNVRARGSRWRRSSPRRTRAKRALSRDRGEEPAADEGLSRDGGGGAVQRSSGSRVPLRGAGDARV